MSGLFQRRQARVQLTPKQSNIFLWGWQENAKHRVIVAGRRFGKTFLMMEEQRRAVRLAYERGIDTDDEIWYGAPTFKQAERNYWKRAQRATPPEWIEHINNQKMTITYKSGHVFRLVGLDNYDDLRGKGLFFFMGDEWADVKPDAWSEVIDPMFATTDGHSIRIGTPKGYNHFFDAYSAGVEGHAKQADTMSWRYSTLEGGNVTAEWLAKKQATTDERTFRQEYLASFESYSGLIYYSFNRAVSIQPPPWGTQYKSNNPNVSPFYNPNLPVHVGLDFNINPMSALIFQEMLDPKTQQVISWLIDEILIPTSNTHEMGEEISRRYGKLAAQASAHNQYDVRHIWVYPDPAGAGRRTSAHGETDITILRRMGFHVIAMSSHPLVRDRINAVNGRFRGADGTQLLFVSPHAKKAIEALEKHQYKEGTSEPDKGSGWDHLNDALGYYVYTRFTHTKPQLFTIAHIGR